MDVSKETRDALSQYGLRDDATPTDDGHGHDEAVLGALAAKIEAIVKSYCDGPGILRAAARERRQEDMPDR